MRMKYINSSSLMTLWGHLPKDGNSPFQATGLSQKLVPAWGTMDHIYKFKSLLENPASFILTADSF